MSHFWVWMLTDGSECFFSNTLWGSYLDTVGFLANSPIRPYIAQTMEKGRERENANSPIQPYIAQTMERRLRPEILTVFRYGPNLMLFLSSKFFFNRNKEGGRGRCIVGGICCLFLHFYLFWLEEWRSKILTHKTSYASP